MKNEDYVYLCNLNTELKSIEKQIVERVSMLLKIGARLYLDTTGFSSDYTFEAEVEYKLKNEDSPFHIYRTHFNYEETILNKNYGMFFTDDENDFNRPARFPRLDQPYCYLLHDLLDHTNYDYEFSLRHANTDCEFPRQLIDNAFMNIDSIWVVIKFKDFRGLKIKNNGEGAKLVYNADKRIFR